MAKGQLIVAVDDETHVLRLIRHALSADDHEVVTFNDVNDALEYLADHVPAMILSDVRMPSLSGFDFKVAYTQRFDQRATPFVFLSSMSDATNVLEGLRLGADDYMTKPISQPILRAKVLAILTRIQRVASSTIAGDLATFSIPQLLTFAERQGMNGELEVHGETTIRAFFRAGLLVGPDGSELPNDELDRIFSHTEGRFVLHSRPVDFSDLRAHPAQPLAVASEPTGLLSSIRAEDRVFQIQTEISGARGDQAVTVVLFGGRTLLKKVSDVGVVLTSEQIRAQHSAVEAAVHNKLKLLAGSEADREQTVQATYTRLFEEGMSRYLEKDYEGASEAWDKALALQPTNEVLRLNLEIIARKLKS